MSETKLTPAQKRAIREARSDGLVSIRIAMSLPSLTCDWNRVPPPDAGGCVFLTTKGWAVEVGDDEQEGK